jgi:hypothetical protein
MTPLELDRRHYPYYERDDYGRCPICGEPVDHYATDWVLYAADCNAHRKCAEPDLRKRICQKLLELEPLIAKVHELDNEIMGASVPATVLEDALYNISLYMGRNRAKVEAAARTGEAL